MKIILYGLKMKSEIMDVPENTTPIFKIALTQPILAKFGNAGDEIGKINNTPICTICEFEWIGKFDVETSARIYTLKDIYKK